MRRVSGGFTLIEVTVSMLLVAIGMVALWSAIVSGLMLVESGRNLTQANGDARIVLEEMRRLAATALTQVTATNWVNWAADPNGGNLTNPQTRTNPPPLSNEAVSVTYVNPLADPLTATVTLSWVEKGRPKSIPITTLLTRR